MWGVPSQPNDYTQNYSAKVSFADSSREKKQTTQTLALKTSWPGNTTAATLQQKPSGAWRNHFHNSSKDNDQRASSREFFVRCECKFSGRRLTQFLLDRRPSIRNVPVTPTPSIFPKVLPYKWGAYCRTNWRCTAVLFTQVVGVGVSEI